MTNLLQFTCLFAYCLHDCCCCSLSGTALLFGPLSQILQSYSRKWWWTETKTWRYGIVRLKTSVFHFPLLPVLSSCFSDYDKKSVHTRARAHWMLQNYSSTWKQCPPDMKLHAWTPAVKLDFCLGQMKCNMRCAADLCLWRVKTRMWGTVSGLTGQFGPDTSWGNRQWGQEPSCSRHGSAWYQLDLAKFHGCKPLKRTVKVSRGRIDGRPSHDVLLLNISACCEELHCCPRGLH